MDKTVIPTNEPNEPNDENEDESLENQIWFQIIIAFVIFFSIGLFIILNNTEYSKDYFIYIDRISDYIDKYFH